MEQKLKDYVNDKAHYTKMMIIMMNDRSKDWYGELGKYIAETLDIEKIPYLSFFADKLKEKGVIKKIKNFIDDNIYPGIAIHFLTGVLDEKALENMFGKPLFHDEFGEGFDGEYDEETDEYADPEIKESYASYFVNVGGTDFHIGYDHRGTNIEIGITGKFQFGKSTLTAEEIFDSLKKLVDLYKLKN